MRMAQQKISSTLWKKISSLLFTHLQKHAYPLPGVTKSALKYLLLVLQSSALARFEALEEIYKNLMSNLFYLASKSAQKRGSAHHSHPCTFGRGGSFANWCSEEGGHKFVNFCFDPLTCSFNPISGILHNSTLHRGGVICLTMFREGGSFVSLSFREGGSRVTFFSEVAKWPAQ